MGGQVGRQPAALGRAGVAASGIRTIRVQRDQVPGTNVVAVVALTRDSGSGAKVAEIAGRTGIGGIAPSSAGGQVFVVTDDGVGDRLDLTPAQVVRGLERGEAAAVVLRIAEREDGREVAGYEEIGGLLLLAYPSHAEAAVEVGRSRVAGDVAGGCDHGIGLRGRHGWRSHGRSRRPGRNQERDRGSPEEPIGGVEIGGGAGRSWPEVGRTHLASWVRRLRPRRRLRCRSIRVSPCILRRNRAPLSRVLSDARPGARSAPTEGSGGGSRGQHQAARRATRHERRPEAPTRWSDSVKRPGAIPRPRMTVYDSA